MTVPYIFGTTKNLSPEDIILLDKYSEQHGMFTSAKTNQNTYPPVVADNWTLSSHPRHLKSILLSVFEEHDLWDIDIYNPIQFSKNIEVLKYANTGEFPWHIDTTQDQVWNCTLRETNDETIVGDYNVAVVDALDRKVTCILSLSSDYEGGNFQIREIDSEDIIFDRRLLFGEYIIFPTVYPHRVTSVTGGERHVLASWLKGKPYNA